eukprot:gene7171-biopygen11811
MSQISQGAVEPRCVLAAAPDRRVERAGHQLTIGLRAFHGAVQDDRHGLLAQAGRGKGWHGQQPRWPRLYWRTGGVPASASIVRRTSRSATRTRGRGQRGVQDGSTGVNRKHGKGEV